MKKILVTGSTGFIGNHLIPELIKVGYEVIATGIEDKNNLNLSWINKVTYIQYDLHQNPKGCYELFHKPDKLIHLAWEGLPHYKELFHFEKNLFASYHFIKNLILSGLNDVTVLGTCFEYGMQNGELSEQLPSHPSNSYALAKDTLRKFLEELKKHHAFNLKWIRLFYLFGDGQGKNSILEQVKSAIKNHEKVFNMSGGEQLRDYLPVTKVAEYIAKISSNDDFTGIVNCCSGSPISIRNLVEEYLKENNSSLQLNLGYYPYPDFEPMAFWGSTEKLYTILKNEE